MFFTRASDHDARTFIEHTHRKLLGSTHQGAFVQSLHNTNPRSTLSNLSEQPADDSEQESSKKTLRILCFSMSRTGTLSLMGALQQLGYTPYHMTIAMDQPSRDLPSWLAALEAKFEGKGNRWGAKEEFERVIGGYDALLDIPGAYFEELLEMYPKAKVIITQRPVDEWLKSISDTVGHVLSWRTWPLISWADPNLTHPWYTFMRYTDLHLSFWTSACSPRTQEKTRAAYLAHYARLAALLQDEHPGRVLYLKAGDGWIELCKFLDQKVPRVSDWDVDDGGKDGMVIQYPKLNDTAMYVAFHEAMWRRAVGMAVRKIGMFMLVMAVGVVMTGWCGWW